MAEGRTRRLLDPVLLGAVIVVLVALAALALAAYDHVAVGSPGDAPLGGDGVPRVLPNGDPLPGVPEPLARAFDRPVVLASGADPARARPDRCGTDVEWEYSPTERSSFITPEGLVVALRGEERGSGVLFHVACYAQWNGRGWETWASWVGEVADPQVAVGTMDRACCREDGAAVASAELEAPDTAVWALQDRGEYWLAYPVVDGLVQPVWLVEGDEGAPLLVHVDASGNRVGEPGVG